MNHTEAFLKLAEEARRRIREIPTSAVAAVLAERRAVLIDVREESEWRSGHAAGALHLSRGIIEREIEARVPDLETPIVCYCGAGNRSALAADSLQKLGYRNVSSIAGGFNAWLAGGLPVQSTG